MSFAESTQNVPYTMSLEEQIARLQALLEASRQVHSTIAGRGDAADRACPGARTGDGRCGFLSAETGELMASYGDVAGAPL